MKIGILTSGGDCPGLNAVIRAVDDGPHAWRWMLGVMAVPAVIAMRGHWHLLRRNVPRLLAYGVFAVAGCQFDYFMAVDHLSVGVALFDGDERLTFANRTIAVLRR